jgi:hypothetical protein
MPIQPFHRSKTIIAVAVVLTLTCTLYGCLSFPSASANAVEHEKKIVIPGKGIAVYAAGDIAECGKLPPHDSGAAKTAEVITANLAQDQAAVVLTLGDNSYPLGVPAEFTDCYHPTWGQFKTRTHPSSGNHEYYTPSANGYFNYFGAAAGPAPAFYYSFDLGKWHLLSLNSNLKGDARLAELAWIKSDLAQHNTRCTLAYWHHPLFSSGGHGNNADMREFWLALEAAHADIVLNGHDHDYERFAPQDDNGQSDEAHGIREFVVGTGGAKLTRLFLRKANSEFADSSTHGILKLVLKDAGYEWEFLPVAGGTLTDRGAALCH